MRRIALHRVAVFGVAIAVAATVLTGGSAQASPDLARAHAKATQLRRQLSALELQQSVAIERYDGVQAELAQAVSAELSNADVAVEGASRARAAQDAVVGRARALYMSGGQLGLMATVLNGGTPADMLTAFQSVRSVIAADQLNASAQRLSATQSLAAAQASTATRQHITALRAQASESLAQVQTLLTRQRTLLGQADRTVLRLARAEQRAADARALAAANSSGRAAGVPVDSGSSGSLPAIIQGPNAAATTAIAAARTRLGMPYLWGATGPTRFDCSGLLLWSYRQAGITLPRTSRAQYAGLAKVPLSQLQPGDLTFYATNTSDPGTIHHVAMYVGMGLVINAPHTGDVVRYAPVAMSGLMGAVRPTL